MSHGAPRRDPDAISPELRLAADDLAVAVLRLVRAIEGECGPARADDTETLPARAGAEQQLAYTIPEAAAVLRVSESTVRRQIQAGTLPALRIGKRLLIRRATLERLMDEPAPSAEQEGPAGLRAIR